VVAGAEAFGHTRGPVPVDIQKKTWLADLVDAQLGGYDPAAARMRLPRDLRDPDPEGPDLESRARLLVVRSLRRRLVEAGAPPPAAFTGIVEGHVALLLDLALLLGAPFEIAERRAEVATILAAGTGDLTDALKVAPARSRSTVPAAAVGRTLVRTGDALLRVLYPPGDPQGGLSLYAGTVAIQRRLLARVALHYFQQVNLDPDFVVAQLEQGQDELVLLVETLAGLAAADAPVSLHVRHLVHRQIDRLDLDRERAPRARAAISAPREPEDICLAAPPRLRRFLLEQLLLAALGRTDGNTAHGDFIGRFAQAAGISPEELAAMQIEAAAFHADHQEWFRAFGLPESPEWSELAEEWNEFGERMVEKVAAVVTENMEAIATELRETGELGSLLAKATKGQTLTAAERKKVKEQLIDLAKTVPALAIFAAPGGLVLLPLLAKLLPFSLLPSAFQSKGKGGAKGR